MDKKCLKWIVEKTNKSFIKLAVLVMLSVVCATSSVVIALYTKGIIDSAVDGNKNGILYNTGVLLLILLVFLTAKISSGMLKEKTKSKIEISLRKHFLVEVVGKEYSKITAYHSGDLLTRMFSDITIISEGIVSIVPAIAAITTGAISAIVLLSAISYKFCFLLVLGGLVIYVASRYFRKLIKKLHKALQTAYSKLRSFVQEVFINLLAVKTNDANSSVEKKTEFLQNEHFKLRMKKRKVSIIANTGLEFVFDFGYLCALLWGAFMLSTGSITYGTLTALLQLVTKVQQPFAAVSGILPGIYSVAASVERIMEIESIANETVKSDTAFSVSDKDDFEIKFSDVSFSYDRDKIFDGLNMNVKNGEFVAVMGSSGIGKSTALKLLLGVLNGYSGKITVDVNGKTYDTSVATRKMFSYVPQGNLLFSGSLRENLCFMTPEADDESVDNAIKLSCCEEFVAELPEGLDTVIGENGHGLSEGQVQRISIARALLKKAPVLLLDEATSALDEATEKKVLSNLKQIKNLTCIIITHKKAALEICDSVYKFENGKAYKI